MVRGANMHFNMKYVPEKGIAPVISKVEVYFEASLVGWVDQLAI